jgi:catechol 2,3-dioxygenase-like lactoylglutathione lyase family enzyme
MNIAYCLNTGLAACALMLAACGAAAPGPSVPGPPEKASVTTELSPLAFSYVVISVADMDRALGLWVERFGMEVVTRRDGSDPDLARAWGLPADGIVDQVLLRTPAMGTGGVHLVRFRTPGPAVRDGAAPTDLVMKSVDISVREMAARHAELGAAGYRFRSAPSRLSAGGLDFSEVHMFGPDDVNIVFVDIPSRPEPVSAKQYGVAPQIVVITPDNVRESAFLQSTLGLALISHNSFSGPAIEKAVGLPAGASLDVRILGNPDDHYGRLELVQYAGATGQRNLHPRAKPPARGMLSVSYVMKDIGPLLSRASALGLQDHGQVSTVLGSGRLVLFTTPAGMRVDLLQPQ